MKIRGVYIAVVAALMIFALAAVGCVTNNPTTTTAPPGTTGTVAPPITYYPGGGYGPGGMMGNGGMMIPGTGIYDPNAQRLTLAQATAIANKFITSRPDLGFKLGEVMEFQFNFYVDYIETSTGIHAFESLVDPYTGDLYPEPGPSVMWNTKYCMMSGVLWGISAGTSPMSLTASQAQTTAQSFLNGYLPGSKVSDASQFYGYYTMDFTLNGKTYGMLSVNGYTGQVWYHNWHGLYLGP
ncbi:peptidase M4 [Dehalogenimonas etheniformans]|uniref:Peptidase M4 n=1 Tax=Dehalogenimonas etheniformans TaxID=1536648 RepID=A0A2P5P6W0_9CHLR|nr:peptidase M4 [Dehalogenimonas etheniformans]PPD58033.1 peptidase M4 [Dehalogenimonas etheniformans]QNT75382.1 peptidase M4 [Dehalogenimonas etheniformans]